MVFLIIVNPYCKVGTADRVETQTPVKGCLGNMRRNHSLLTIVFYFLRHGRSHFMHNKQTSSQEGIVEPILFVDFCHYEAITKPNINSLPF